MAAIIVIVFKLWDSDPALPWLSFIPRTNTIQHLGLFWGAQTTSDEGPALLKLEDKKHTCVRDLRE